MSSLLHAPVPSAASPHLRWHQLYGSAAALALAEATGADPRLYVLIADGARELERLTAELRFFAGDALTLLRLPDWEVLPYDLFSPHPDITSERLKTLFDLPGTRRGCLIVHPVNAFATLTTSCCVYPPSTPRVCSSISSRP